MKYGIKTWNLCAQSQNRSGSMSTQSRTTKPPSRVLLVFEFYLDAMRWFASVWRCSAPFFFFSLPFFLFHLAHCESFHIEYLAALAFLQLLLHWADAGELCLTEQPLALLQSKRLTAVFFHLRLSRASFRVCRLLHADQRNTNASTFPCIQVVYPLLTSPLTIC